MDMAKYVVKRILFMLLTFLIIISMCFVLIRLLPNEPPQQFGKDMQLVLQSRYRQGICDINGNPIPLAQQFWNFLTKSLIGGDWGVSEKLYFGQSCFQVFLSKLPNTVLVNTYSALLAVPVGLMLGIYAALKKNRWQDHLISTSVMILVSVPSYVYAFLIQYFLCYKMKLFPLVMKAGTDYFSKEMFLSMLPAVLSLSLSSIAGYARFTRAELTEVLTSEFMLLARTKGLTRAQATSRHALKNAMVPILPMIISQFVGILGGSFVIENLFSIPGIGAEFTNSVSNRDYTMIMALTVMFGALLILANIVTDLLVAMIDPRIKLDKKS